MRRSHTPKGLCQLRLKRKKLAASSPCRPCSGYPVRQTCCRAARFCHPAAPCAECYTRSLRALTPSIIRMAVMAQSIFSASEGVLSGRGFICFQRSTYGAGLCGVRPLCAPSISSIERAVSQPGRFAGKWILGGGYGRGLSHSSNTAAMFSFGPHSPHSHCATTPPEL